MAANDHETASVESVRKAIRLHETRLCLESVSELSSMNRT
jgi:hypothetical protein